MTISPFTTFTVWQNEAKTTQVASTTNVISWNRTRPLVDHSSLDIELILEDKTTSGIKKGTYCELVIGNPGSTTTWFQGFIQTVSESEGAPGALSIHALSASYFLTLFHFLGALHMKYGKQYSGGTIYGDALAFFNGYPDNTGAYPPGQKGAGTGSGWLMRFVDGVTPTSPVSTTTSGGTVVPGNKSVGVVSTTGMVVDHAVKLGSDFYRIESINSGTNLSISPPSYGTYVNSTTVVDWGAKMPGVGDEWKGDWDSVWNGAVNLCSDYGLLMRERPGSTSHNGVLEVGPLADDSGTTIWGGDSLATRQSRNTTAFGNQPNAAVAQANGDAVIGAAALNEDMANIVNIVWCLGAGEDAHTVTLRSLVGGAPTGNGWTLYTPNGSTNRNWYVKAASKSTYAGNTYSFIAAQQNDGAWSYGVCDQTSVTKYGVSEYTLEKKSISKPDWLLSAALSYLEAHTDPVASWTFTVLHPLTSAGGYPTLPLPGQLVTVNYSGVVHDALVRDTNTLSATYGQWIPQGSYTYLSFPTNPSDSVRTLKERKVIEITDSWDGQQFSAVYTMGKGQWHSKWWSEAVARKMIDGVKKPTAKHKAFKKQSVDHIPFLFSQSPSAWEDITTNTLVMNPGSIAVSDVPDSSFFSDHHQVSYTVQMTDAGQYLDFWFAKPVNANLTSANAGANYGVFRLALTSSGQKTGFYWTSDGSVFHAAGTNHANPHLDSNGRVGTGTYRLYVSWAGGKYKGQLSKISSKGIYNTVDVATYNDGNSSVLSTQGAIGWMLHGGTGTIAIQDFHAHAQHLHHAPQGGVATRQMRSSHHTKKRRRLNASQYSSGTGGISGLSGALSSINGIGRLIGAK